MRGKVRGAILAPLWLVVGVLVLVLIATMALFDWLFEGEPVAKYDD
ncbi:hypothetical protein [Fulvimonas yonginensis]|uniref:Uncharacterized protein n=1 Tax=Fulvimonas yonginensis TaxID=1495200 RepID=A0ABU8JGY7_9GAMM